MIRDIFSEDTGQNLPRFAATREFITRYGDGWSSWAFLATGVVFLAVFAAAAADASPAPFGDVIGAVLTFGVVAFIAGMFFGVLWSGLRDDAKEAYDELR